MTKAEEILKQLDLDYQAIVKNGAWMIRPLDFMSEIKIMLVIGDCSYSMFIWKDKVIQKECKFKEVGNITDIYSFLYNYDKNNLKNKTNEKSSVQNKFQKGFS